jgi:hypothetical protein
MSTGLFEYPKKAPPYNVTKNLRQIGNQGELVGCDNEYKYDGVVAVSSRIAQLIFKN